MQRVAQHVELHHGADVSLRGPARFAGLSPYYLTRLFARYTGRGVMTFLGDVRHREALSLLRTTYLAVAEVARSVGYDAPYYFSRVFRAREGPAPRHYRRRFRAAERENSDDNRVHPFGKARHSVPRCAADNECSPPVDDRTRRCPERLLPEIRRGVTALRRWCSSVRGRRAREHDPWEGARVAEAGGRGSWEPGGER